MSLASWECGPPRTLRISRRRTTTTASHTMPAVAPAGGRGPRARVSARRPLGPSPRLHLTPGRAGEQAHVQATWTPGNLQNPQTKRPPPREDLELLSHKLLYKGIPERSQVSTPKSNTTLHGVRKTRDRSRRTGARNRAHHFPEGPLPGPSPL